MNPLMMYVSDRRHLFIPEDKYVVMQFRDELFNIANSMDIEELKEFIAFVDMASEFYKKMCSATSLTKSVAARSDIECVEGIKNDLAMIDEAMDRIESFNVLSKLAYDIAYTCICHLEELECTENSDKKLKIM